MATTPNRMIACRPDGSIGARGAGERVGKWVCSKPLRAAIWQCEHHTQTQNAERATPHPHTTRRHQGPAALPRRGLAAPVPGACTRAGGQPKRAGEGYGQAHNTHTCVHRGHAGRMWCSRVSGLHARTPGMPTCMTHSHRAGCLLSPLSLLSLVLFTQHPVSHAPLSPCVLCPWHAGHAAVGSERHAGGAAAPQQHAAATAGVWRAPVQAAGAFCVRMHACLSLEYLGDFGDEEGQGRCCTHPLTTHDHRLRLCACRPSQPWSTR